MAILEIAKIQVRRGQENVTGEPTLSPGEFGWAEDTEHLWIGKSVSEGAPDNNNTRILTQNDLTAFITGSASTLTNQIYVGHVPSPGVPISGAVSTTAQSKFDLFVSVLDFGASNDPTTDARSYIQNAIDNLWLNANNGTSVEESIRVALRIPAGVYNLSGPIFLPPYSTLLGEGKGKTVLNLTTSNSLSPLIQFCGGNSSPPAHDLFYPFPGTSQINSTYQPKFITISGMTLAYGTATSKTAIAPLLRADCSIDSVISDVEFRGNYNAGTGDTSNLNYTGLEIRGGNGSSPAKNLLVDNCVFKNTFYGVRSSFDIENTVIQNSVFRELNRGVVLADSITAGNFTGPLRTRVQNSKFIDIEHEGLYCGSNPTTTATNHVSAFNVYDNVGNNLLGDLNLEKSVIRFISPTNVSILDTFSRYNTINSSASAVTATVSWMVAGPTSINDGTVYTSNLSTSTTLARFPFNGSEQTLRVDYNLLKSAASISRKGQLLVNASVLGGVPSANVTDNYSYTGNSDGNLNFSASLNTVTNTVSLNYTSSDTLGTITYKFNILQ